MRLTSRFNAAMLDDSSSQRVKMYKERARLEESQPAVRERRLVGTEPAAQALPLSRAVGTGPEAPLTPSGGLRR